MAKREDELLFEELDRRRTRQAPSPKGIIEAAKSAGIDLTVGQFVHAVLKLGRGYTENVFPLLHIVEFICRYISDSCPKSILDPWAGFGVMLIPLVTVTETTLAVGVTQNADDLEIGKELDKRGLISWMFGNPQEQVDSIKDSFDLVASFPPFNFGGTQWLHFDLGGESVEVSDNLSNILILKSLRKLSESGTGVFIVPPGFIFGNRSKGVYGKLQSCGFKLDAFISLPAGTFAPYIRIPGGIAIIRRGRQEAIFVGELTENPDRATVLLENLGAKRQGSEIALGRFVAAETFRSYDSLVNQEREQAMAARLGRQGMSLATIVKEINVTKVSEVPGFEDRSNAVYLPTIGHSDAVASLAELRLKPNNYFQLVIDPEKADARYLAGFFNTPLGFTVRESGLSGTLIPKVTKSTLAEMRVYLPELVAQGQAVDSQVRISNLVSELSELAERIWASPKRLDSVIDQIKKVNHEDRFEDWLEGLPFPLASILWAYHAAIGNDQRQFAFLSKFFEAVAEFHATLLLSAFETDRDLFNAEKDKLKKAHEKAGHQGSQSTFGLWVAICGNLMKTGRTLINGKPEDKERCRNMFKTHNDKVIETLLSPKLVSIMSDTNALRNKGPGHGGIIGDVEVRRLKSILESHLASLRSCFGNVWENYFLIVPSDLRFDGSSFSGMARRVMGSRTPFAGIEIRTVDPLVAGQLCFKSPDETRALPLLPFVKIMESPQSAQNACYFYNKQERDGIKFVSYHFESEADITLPFPDTLDAINQLWN